MHTQIHIHTYIHTYIYTYIHTHIHIHTYIYMHTYTCIHIHTCIYILYRISALVWRSVTGCAPSYLTDLCRPVSDLASRRALRSSARGELLVPRARSALNSVELSLLLAPPLGMNSLLHSACYLRATCLLSASFLRHFSMTVAGLRAPLSRFLEGRYMNIRNE